MIDKEAMERIQENKELGDKMLEMVEHLSAERHGMIFSSLLVQTAFRVGMSKEELLFIIGDIYDAAKKPFN